jgi:adhesin/invasin
MRQWRGTIAWIVAFLSCSSFGCECDLPHDPVVVTLTPDDGEAVTGGKEFTLTANVTVAGHAAQDVTVQFTSTTAGVTITPASAATKPTGAAQARAFVPYGATAVCTAVTGDGASDVKLVVPGAVHLELTRGIANLVGGQMISITATATDPTATDPMKQKRPGVALGFASNTSGVAFAPASVATSSAGTATASAFVPFSTSGVVAIVSGGGSGSATALSPTAGQLSIGPEVSGAAAFGGTLITVHAQIAFRAQRSDDGVVLEGFPVAFATAASGVPYGAATFAIVSAGGASSVVSFADQLPALAIQLPAIAPPITGTPATSGSSSGLLYSISVNVTDGTAVGAHGLAGVPLTFTATNGATFTPAAAVTDGDGQASSAVFIPNVGNTANGPPGNSRVVVTGPAGATSSALEVP